ncbi:MAG: hypothetical protein ACUVQ8_04930 [Nitrososphaeria archaeon]
MNPRSKVSRFALKVSYGVLSGILWYILYVYIIPGLLVAIGLPFEETPEFFMFLLAFFIALQTSASLIENIVYRFLLNSFTKILGLWLLFKLLNEGVLLTSLSAEGVTVNMTMGFTPILFLVATWTFATIFLDLVGSISSPYL